MKKLYVVWDTVAKAVVSAMLVYAGDPAAVRAFGDALSDAQSPYAAHPKDFQLRCVGELYEAEDGPYVDDGYGDELPSSRVVMTGEQWLLANAKGPQLTQEAIG